MGNGHVTTTKLRSNVYQVDIPHVHIAFYTSVKLQGGYHNPYSLPQDDIEF